MQHVFIIGSKGIPAKYGGFETFVEKLVFYKKDPHIQYHVACIGGQKKEFQYEGARCFSIKAPNIGPAKAVYYDLAAAFYCLIYIRKYKIQQPVVYILACRIGPFLPFFQRAFKKMRARIFVNPDGHEWMRGKWNKWIKGYWKISEKWMVKNANLVICDSKHIESYIKKQYKDYKPKTMFIPYGAETGISKISDYGKEWKKWQKKNGVSPKNYYLIVGRFVPENNYERMIKEFCASRTKKDLVIITKADNKKLEKRIKEHVPYEKDPRIKFVGVVYHGELLKKIRENAYGYIHGHEVGGTNPSLLEAMATTPLNLLLDVGFNREVGEEGALYWNKREGSLRKLITDVDEFPETKIKAYEAAAKERVRKGYTWEGVVEKYEKRFIGKDVV